MTDIEKEVVKLAEAIENEMENMVHADNLDELDGITQHARDDIEKLGVLIYRAKFSEGSDK